MNRIAYVLILVILTANGCGRSGRGMPPDGDSTKMVRHLYNTAMQLNDENDEDSALAVMLVAADYAPGCYTTHWQRNMKGKTFSTCKKGTSFTNWMLHGR